jgi:hypothetical protein
MIFDAATVAHFENPELFPVWIWGHEVEPISRLRGLAYYSYLEASGLRVQHVAVGSENSRFQLKIEQPWTYVIFPVPMIDWTQIMGEYVKLNCSFILDVHFPIMNLSQATSLVPGGVLQLVKSQEMMLANLAVADAVTVSNSEWAAELSEFVDNVFYLPDLVMPDWAYGDDTAYAGDEDGTDSFTTFVAKMASIQASSQQVHIKRRQQACDCAQCKAEREIGS